MEEEQTPTPLKKGNVLGTKLIGTINYTLAGRFNFDVNSDEQNTKNLVKMHLIQDWIVEQELLKKYPTFENDEKVTGIEILSSPFLFGIDKSTTYSRYQMQIQIKYEKRIDING